MKEIDDAIEDLKTENELLKLDIAYLGVKQKAIQNKRLEHSRYGYNSKTSKTFEVERHNDTMLTFADDERFDEKFNESGFNNISNIQLERQDYITRSLDGHEFTKAIDEVKEEDEISETDTNHCLRSPPLKIESLTNDTSCIKSQIKSLLKNSSCNNENLHPNSFQNLATMERSSTDSLYEAKLNHYKSEIAKLLKERKESRK